MQNHELNLILAKWKAEANVRNEVMYKTFCPRDGGNCMLYIYTEQPGRMEDKIIKYHQLLSTLPIFRGQLIIDIIKVNRCIH